MRCFFIQIDKSCVECIINGMKKVISLVLLLLVVALSGCGVKSGLKHPGDSYPRDYPVY